MNATLSDHLQASLKGENATPSTQAALALCQAVDSNRISFGLEPFHALAHAGQTSTSRMPMEYLLRPAGIDGTPIALGPALQTIRQMGLVAQMDMQVIPRAIEQAIQYGDVGFPVSVNIAPESLGDDMFLDKMGTYLHSLKARINDLSDVVLEVPLKGHTSPKAIAWLHELSLAGFRIAIDNFGAHQPFEFSTIGTLQPSFVKLDGAMVENALLGLPGLESLVKQVRLSSPQSRLLAVWVPSVEDAKLLHDTYGIDAVQGRKLPRDRAYFSSQWDFLLYAERKRQQAWV